MKRHERTLKFDDMTGKALAARCTLCHRVFIGKPNAGEATDDVLLRMRQEFDSHNCHEDAVQAAVRVGRESTGQR
jgi:hypothetical protein